MQTPTTAKKTSSLKGLLQSPLSRQLLLCFSILPLVEAVFLAVLCYDINTMEHSATEEFRGARACLEFSLSMESLKKVNDSLHMFKEDDADPVMIPLIHKQNQVFWNDVNIALKDLKNSGEFSESFDVLDTNVRGLYERVKNTLVSSPENVRASYADFKQYLEGAYPAFQKLMEQASKAEAAHKLAGRLFNLDPMTLLYIAAAANVAYIIALATFIKLRITEPITLLAKSCEQLIIGKAIDRPKQTKSEIGALNESFYLMSLQIAEDKKRRTNYLELLQTVQTMALLKVNGWLDTVLSFKSFSEQTRKRLDKAKGSISTLISILRSMTETLNDTSKKNFTLQLKQCNSTTLCQSAATAVEALLESRKVKLKCAFADKDLSTDPILIGRVLVNFLSNAIKYSPEGGEIEFSAIEQNNSLIFKVKDNGPGISAKDKDKLFKRFSQLHAVDGVKRAGTGLGLVICKEIVEEHGGKVGCESEEGKGSTFWFELPLKSSGASGVVQSKARSNSTNKWTGSLNNQFAGMLLAFVLVQGILFWQLQATFQESESSAESFSKERWQILELEDLYATLLLSGQAGSRREFDEAAELLDKMGPKLTFIASNEVAGSRVSDELNEIARRRRFLVKVLKYVQDHPEKMMSIFAALEQKAHNAVDQMEASIYKIFRMKRQSFQTSYKGQKDLSSKILTLLIIAALADILIIASVAVLSLKIVEKIYLLKTKSDDFAAGKQIEPNISGNDELSLLDFRLCEASLSIQEAEAQKQELIAVINHDLRTPLSSVLSSLEAITQGVYGNIEGEPAAILQSSEQELKRLLSQINDLLMLEKIDSGTYELAKDTLSFKSIIEESLSLMQDSAKGKDLRVLLEDSAKNEDQLVAGDKLLLIRLCTILLANAINASPARGQIKLAVKKTDGVLLAEIENQGTAIDPELKNQIFDRFRFVKAKPITGMGLPLAYRVCKMHGGSIDLEPDDSKNITTFAVRLPLSV